MQTIEMLPDSWTRVFPEGAGLCYIQGVSGAVFLSDAPPVSGDPGIALRDNAVIPIDVDKFSHVWVRGTGVAVFAG